MSYDLGGRADKLGNRYEGRWVALQLLHMLNEEVVSVTVESIGDDERGVDLWISKKNAKKLAQQCKGRNGNKDTWNSNDFARAGIWEYIKFHFERDPDNEFEFVSGASFNDLNDLCNSARNCPDDPELFYDSRIKFKNKRELLLSIFDCFGLDHNNKDDRVKIFYYLCRLYFTNYPDDNNSWNNLKFLASMLVSGAPESVIALLQDYAVNNDYLGKPIYADDLWKYIKCQGHFSQNFAHDSHILPKIEHMQDAFEDTISSRFINGDFIPREEAIQCLNCIKKNPSLIILHGPAGCGKSSILFNAVKQLNENGYLCLPVRLDRHTPQNTAEQFGKEFDLPASPVICLTEIAKDRDCVFVIDQLDAIRWTSSHSSNALDVCKDLVRQVYCYQKQEKRISLIISCRTFDLNNDPEIREWINGTTDYKWKTIEIQPLSEKTVRNIVGNSYDQISNDCKKILSNPQNLFMWLEIIKTEKHPSLSSLSSTTALMKLFWNNKWDVIQRTLNSNRNISMDDINSVIDDLVNNTEASGKISVPRLLIPQKMQGAVKILESQGIIHQDNACFSFCHQSYLDYLIGDKLCREIIKDNKKILDWLGEKNKQTLFKREQLRQALALLATDIPESFIKEICQILDSPNVRFHMKHLILEIISTTDPTLNEELSYFMLKKLEDPIDREVILEVVFYGNKAWTELIINNGILNSWLNGECPKQRKDAFALLRSIAHVIPDKVTELLDPYVNQGDKWFADILDVIGWDVAKDSDKLFKIRIKLLTYNYFPPFLDWPEIAESNPLRAINLVVVLLNLLPEKIDMYNRVDHFQRCHGHEIKALLQTAGYRPIDTWKKLMPVVMQMTSNWPESKFDSSIEQWKFERDSHKTLERCSVEMLIQAGRSIAEHDPVLFIDLTRDCETNPSPVVQEILIESYSAIEHTFADNAIEWLLADLNRFQLGNGETKVVWAPAMRLLESLSAYCSPLIFNKLEDAIINYHDPDELDHAKYCLPLWKDGYSGDYWGRCQYHLLPSLASDRRKDTTNALIRVLERKFACYNKQRFLLGAEFKGGFVGSPLDKNIACIKDKTWLEIISNKSISRNNGWKWEQIDEDSVNESSIFQFSRSLRHIAISCPERFGQLSLMFPNDVDLYYVSAIFQAMASTEAKNEVLPEFKDKWVPASFSTVIKVVDHYIDLIKKDEIAIDFCRLVEARANDPWPDYLLDALQEIAKDKTKSSKINDNYSVRQIDNATINCARGMACHALASLLWSNSSLYSKIYDTVNFLSFESDPIVLMAFPHILCSIIKIDKELAVSFFCSAANKELRIFGGNYGIKFINATIQEKYNFYAPFLYRMISSQNEEFQKLGARMISAYNLFFGCFSDYIDMCRNGPVAVREGLSMTATRFISDPKYAEKCRDYISQLMNDPENEVCAVVAGMFNEKFFNIPENISWMVEYVKSAAFLQESFVLLHELNDSKNSLSPFAEIILEICSVVINKKEYKTKKYSDLGQIMYSLPQLLLRLYEQALENDISVAERCLDAWDLFFQYRIGNTRALAKSIEV